MNSSGNKSIVNSEYASEESGWTAYFEDFSLNYNQKENISCCSSLVSDAAWNGFEGYGINQVKKLNFKNPNKRNNYKKYSCDDDLEDTASSPVNSPKISSLNHSEVNYKRTNQPTFGDFLQGKPAADSINFSTEFGDERNGKNIIADSKNINEYVDLKKKGLCLMPVSAFMNYLN